jgi:REP element-mobilizing transposase RayT
MSHTYTNLIHYFVFGTYERRPLLTTDIRKDVFAYIGGILRELDSPPLIINGMPDHVHILAQCGAAHSCEELMRVVKTNSSRWIHQKWPQHKTFAWQRGYGAFSVSRSGVPAAVKYINEQEKHHARVDFREEFLKLLRAHQVTCDERFLWK